MRPLLQCLVLVWAGCAMLRAQGTTGQPPVPAPAPTAASQNAPEMATRVEPTAFQAKVNLVMVPVVVRNAQGHAIGNLGKESFQLFDKGKPQEISRFTVENTGAPGGGESKSSGGQPAPIAAEKGPPVIAPERFVAYLFDDVHLALGDLVRVRDAADRHMATLGPADRAAVYAMSGEVSLDFTDDRTKLHEALLRLRPGVMVRAGALTDLEQRTLGSLANLKQIINRMAIAPGQRTLMFISPGFNTFAPEYIQEETDILERAIKANVIISTLDARGLFTDPSYDASRSGTGRGGSLSAAIARANLLAELAAGTGGTFFQNSNDLDEGFRRLAAAPEYVYLLGFSPQNLKLDGSFHSLRVTLKNGGNVSIQARRGYYAPKHMEDEAENARQEIESALFSREEILELPIELHTQFFKTSDQAARLAVLAHLDLKLFKFQKVEGRNGNEVTLVYGLFDRDGNYTQGIKKVLTLRLKDETLERLGQGVTVRTTFDVKPGTYLIRLVVRDAEERKLSATNGAVQIQ
ncbi:MAG: VWA domain-containing protein [Bryobacteraceae bacterium]